MKDRAYSHYLDKQNSRESNARTYSRKFPIVIKEAKGILLEDLSGKTYYDCLSGAGTLALGHNHPAVTTALVEHLNNNHPLHTLDLITPTREAFVDELFDSLPPEFAKSAKIQFCGPTGADAVEAALKLIKTATGRRSILTFQGGYHGMTHGALSLMGNIKPKAKVPGLMPDVHFLPFPYAYRCPFGIGEEGYKVNSRFVENMLRDPESGITPPAGMILEAVQGEGGTIIAPDPWLREIRRITEENQIPLILDEVQSGVGRTGRMFAFEHAGIVPDVVIISKAIGGSLPMSVLLYHEKLDVWEPGAHAGTFRGNQLAMTAGIATLRYIKENRLMEHASRMGELLVEKLRTIGQRSHTIGQVRGRGLMVGVEIVNTESRPDHLGSFPAHPEMARTIQKECFKRGLILELGGRHGCVVRFLPPLIVTREQLDEICEIFELAVSTAEQELQVGMLL